MRRNQEAGLVSTRLTGSFFRCCGQARTRWRSTSCNFVRDILHCLHLEWEILQWKTPLGFTDIGIFSFCHLLGHDPWPKTNSSVAQFMEQLLIPHWHSVASCSSLSEVWERSAPRSAFEASTCIVKGSKYGLLFTCWACEQRTEKFTWSKNS